MKKLVGTLLFATFLSLFAHAQLTEKLINQDVVNMVSAGIAESVIISKIKNSTCIFETTTDALKALTLAKVPDSIITAMIETTSNRKGLTEEKNSVAESAPPQPKRQAESFTPYSQLSKDEQKRRLKMPVAIQIAASADEVSQLFIRQFQSNGYHLESRTTSSLYLVRDQKGAGSTILAAMAGGSDMQWQVNVSISEFEGVSDVTIDVWLSMQNSFGKRTRDSATKTEKHRKPLEDILWSIKNTAENQQKE